MSKSFYLTVAAVVLAAIFFWMQLFRTAAYELATIPPMPKPIHHVAHTAQEVLVPAPGEEKNTNDIAEIFYSDAGYGPNTITVKAGTTITFKNKSSSPFWPAANPHPMHIGYPTTGGCRASTFDACKEIPPGGTWSFKFDVRGTWRYHDHLNPGDGGTVAVE